MKYHLTIYHFEFAIFTADENRIINIINDFIFMSI